MATRTLLDTNVVLRLLSQSDAQHASALSAVQAELQDETDLVLALQVEGLRAVSPATSPPATT